jgi:hypothetical protein
MLRIVLLATLALSVAGCDRFNDRFGARKAPGSRGADMVGVVSPSGMKVPASAVGSEPSVGYWNCEGNRPEHAVRCTLHEPVKRANRR